MTIKVILMVITVIVIIYEHGANGQQCTTSGIRKVDGIVANLITIGSSGRKFPENKGQDLKNFCDENKNYIKEIERYKNKCMKNLPKQVTAVLVYTIKNSINQLCTKQSKKLDDLIAGTKCFNAGVPEMNRCYTAMIDGFLGAYHVNDTKKIPHVCCEYYRMFPCIQNRIKRIPICTEDHIQTGLDYVKSILGNVIDLLCGDYVEGSDKCEKLGRPPKKLKTQRRSKSFMIPLVDLFDTFAQV